MGTPDPPRRRSIVGNRKLMPRNGDGCLKLEVWRLGSWKLEVVSRAVVGSPMTEDRSRINYLGLSAEAIGAYEKSAVGAEAL